MNNIPKGATHADYKNPDFPTYHRKAPAGEWMFWSEYSSEWVVARLSPTWRDSGAEFRLEPLRQSTTATTAPSILEAAAGHMRGRAATYDKPEGERSMGATVQAFKAVTGHGLTEEQGWLFMQLLKAVRSQQGAYSEDSYADGAAYVALAGEAAARDRS
jgi:hypothetical protein